MIQARHLALAVTRVLPGWLSSLAFSLLFLAVWLSPEWFGWDSMSGLQAVVVIEVLTVHAFLFMFAGREHPQEWIPVVYVALFLGVVLFNTVGILLAFILPLHLIARVAGLWSDVQTRHAVITELLSTIALMGVCWLAVGLLPLPELGWTRLETPPSYWWEAPSFGGGRRVPFGLPAWAFFYFFLTTVADLFRLFLRFVDRTAQKSTLGAA